MFKTLYVMGLFSGSNFKVNVDLSWSKFMAFYILSLGFILEFFGEVGGSFIAATTASTGLLVNKQYQDRKKTDIVNK